MSVNYTKDQNENFIDCPVFWRLSEKWENFIELDKEKSKLEEQQLVAILDRIATGDPCNDVYLHVRYRAFCHAFRTGQDKYFEQFLLQWPMIQLVVKIMDTVEDYIDLPDLSENIISSAAELVQIFCRLTKNEQLKRHNILDLSKLPVYFSSSYIPLQVFEFENAGKNSPRKSKGRCSARIIINWRISNEEDALELLKYDPFPYCKLHVLIRFNYLWISDLDIPNMSNVLKSNFCRDIYGIRISSAVLNLTQLMSAVAEIQPKGEAKVIHQLRLENNFLAVNQLSDVEIAEIMLAVFQLPNIKSLDIRNNNLQNVLRYFTDHCMGLVSLILRNCYLRMFELNGLLASHHKLSVKHLDLSKNDFLVQDSLQALFRILEAFSNLEYVKLSNASVDIIEMKAIGEALVKHNKKLNFLDVTWNFGARELLPIVLKGLPHLRYFHGNILPPLGISVEEYIQNMVIIRENKFPLCPVIIRNLVDVPV